MKEVTFQDSFYEADTRKHQQLVQERMIRCATLLLSRAVSHDESKFSEVERESYTEPVWELNTKEVPYGSDEYSRLTKMMGEGWEHHKANNRHHPEYFEIKDGTTDPFAAMDLLDLLEMCCDWIAASKRRGNDPSLPIENFRKKNLSSQLESVLRNTLKFVDTV